MNPERSFGGTNGSLPSEAWRALKMFKKNVFQMVQYELFLRYCNKTCIKSKLNDMPNILLVSVQMFMKL